LGSNITERQFRSHLRKHLEQLALFALPRDEIDSDTDDETPQNYASDNADTDNGESSANSAYDDEEGVSSGPKTDSALLGGQHAARQQDFNNVKKNFSCKDCDRSL